MNPQREAVENAALAINRFGLDLHRSLAGETPGANLLLSPHSLQSALALALRGADGETLGEMTRVLRVSATETSYLEGLALLDKELASVAERSALEVRNAAPYGGPQTPVTLSTANRLFGQKGYQFRQDYLGFAASRGTPFGELDFRAEPEASRISVNRWISEKTTGLIPELIAAGQLSSDTRLVIANALYFKASWRKSLHEAGEGDFQKADGSTVKAGMMSYDGHLPAARLDGYTAVSLPYAGGELSFLILLPEKADGLSALENTITPEKLSGAARLATVKTELKMPRLSLRPPVVSLARSLSRLGLKTAFDHPKGSANFSRLAERRPTNTSPSPKSSTRPGLIWTKRAPRRPPRPRWWR